MEALGGGWGGGRLLRSLLTGGLSVDRLTVLPASGRRELSEEIGYLAFLGAPSFGGAKRRCC